MSGAPRSLRVVGDLRSGGPALAVFLLTCLGTQVFVHARLGGVWMAVGYPIASAAFSLIVLALVDRFCLEPPPTAPQPRRLAVELGIVVLIVVVHVATLTGQSPHALVANNPATAALRQLIAPLHRWTGTWWAPNLLLWAIVPIALLSPLRRDPRAFGLRGFRWQLLVVLVLVYAPLLLLSGATPTIAGIGAYLLGAAIPEEVLYRGVLQQRLQEAMSNKLLAVVLASLVFGFMHLPINAAKYGWSTAVAFCIGQNAFGGFLTGYIYLRTGSVPLAALQHVWAGTVMGAAR